MRDLLNRVGARALSILLMAIVALSVTAARAADEFEDQPAGQSSNITCTSTVNPTDAESLTDLNFATALHNALGDNAFHSMVLHFSQCYGGGVIDDVADAFVASTQPIAMTSASKHDEQSESAPEPPAGEDDNGFNFWSEAYKNVHPGKTAGTNNNPTENDAFTNAKNDPAFQGKTTKTPQLKTSNGGGNIKLGDGTNGSGATSYHAIIAVGDDTNRPDYWNDAVRQHNMLTGSGYPAGNITMLYGNGTAPTNATTAQGAVAVDGAATRQNLLDEIAALSAVMNSNEQLYIYIGDHGSPDQGGDTQLIPALLIPGPSNTFPLPALEPFQQDALGSADNTSGPYVEMAVQSTSGPITPNWQVLFNNQPINPFDNQLPPGANQGTFRFLVEPSLIDPSPSGNFVSLVNPNPTDPDLEVELFFSMGDLETIRAAAPPPVPTSSATTLLLLGLLLLAMLALLARRRGTVTT